MGRQIRPLNKKTYSMGEAVKNPVSMENKTF